MQIYDSKSMDTMLDTLEATLDTMLDTMLDTIYPVGSIFATIDDSYDPNTKLKGTWERIKPGHTLWSANSGGGNT